MLVDAASDSEIGMVSVDPLVGLHTGREDDNDTMNYVMDILQAIAEAANVAFFIPQHTRKSDGKVSYAGDSSAGRGASSIGYAARFDYTLWTPTKQECEEFGIPLAKRFDFVRLDDAKMNYSKRQGLRGWLQKPSVRLPAGDMVGALVPYDMTASTDQTLVAWATTIATEMRGAARASCTLNEAANYLKMGDALCGKLASDVLRARVKSALASARDTPVGRLRLQRELTGGRWVEAIVLE